MGAPHVILEESLDVAAADLGDGPFNVGTGESLFPGESLQHHPHHVVHGAAARRRVPNYEIEERAEQLALEVNAGVVVSERAGGRVVGHTTHLFR